MVETKSEYHWIQKLFIGRGTLKQFNKDYDLVNSVPGQFVVASTLFPTGQLDDTESVEKLMVFEYVIYYKKSPHINKTIDSTGKIVDEELKPVIADKSQQTNLNLG